MPADCIERWLLWYCTFGGMAVEDDNRARKLNCMKQYNVCCGFQIDHRTVRVGENGIFFPNQKKLIWKEISFTVKN